MQNKLQCYLYNQIGSLRPSKSSERPTHFEQTDSHKFIYQPHTAVADPNRKNATFQAI